MERKKYLAKNTALFALNSIGTRIINFLLVPLYTNVLSTSQYGEVDLVATIAVIIVPLITLNIGEAVMRFALDENANIDSIVDIGCFFTLISLLTGAIIFPLLYLFSSIKVPPVYVYLYCVTQGLFSTTSCVLRGEEKLFDYAICNILNTILTAGFNILLLVVFHKGVPGYFLAYILAYICASIYAGIRGNIKRYLHSFHVDWKLSKKMVAYSIVLVPNSLMWWIMNSSDRIMVTSMIDIEANGVYAISYKIPSAMAALSTVFNQAWMYSAIHEENSKDSVEFNNKMLTLLSRFLFLTITFLLLILRPFLKIYVSENYYSAWEYTPYLLVGYYFMTIGTFLSTSYTVHKDSKGFLISGTVGAITNIVMNYFLIPVMGVSGAALATCISYISVFIYRYFNIQKYMKLSVFDREKIGIYIYIVILAVLEYLPHPWYLVSLGIGTIIAMIAERDMMKDIFAKMIAYFRFGH